MDGVRRVCSFVSFAVHLQGEDERVKKRGAVCKCFLQLETSLNLDMLPGKHLIKDPFPLQLLSSELCCAIFFFFIFLTISTCRFHKYFPNSPGVTLIGPSSVWIRRALLPILSQVTNLTVYATVPHMVNSHLSSGRKKDAAFSSFFFLSFFLRAFQVF